MEYKDLKIRKIKKPKRSGVKVLAILLIIGMVVGSGIVLAKKGRGWFDPISIIATVAASNLKEDDGRTNVLLLGSDKRSSGAITSELTDTLLVASIGRVDHDVVLISLPRDLWITDPIGAKLKINEVYKNYDRYLGSGGSPVECNGKTLKSSGDAIMTTVENTLGIPIHYYIVINFELFQEVVDTLGGVEVDVERSFSDYWYPVEGKENAPLSERYQTVIFEQGLQKMDGERALKYVRSRKGTNLEDTDFARSERQQKVISAIKSKTLSLETLINPGKIKELFDLYEKKVDTNISFGDVQNFYLLSQQISFDKVVSIVLDDRSASDEGGLLYSPQDNELYGGAYVLIPKAGDFSQLHAYVQRFVFGKK